MGHEMKAAQNRPGQIARRRPHEERCAYSPRMHLAEPLRAKGQANEVAVHDPVLERAGDRNQGASGAVGQASADPCTLARKGKCCRVRTLQFSF